MEASIKSLQETMSQSLTFLKKGMTAWEKPKHEEGEPLTEEEHLSNPLSSYFKVKAEIDIIPFDSATDDERWDDWLR